MLIRSREGVIIEWPLNGQFHDAVTNVLTSRINVRDLADDDDEPTLGTLINCYKSLKWRFLTIFWLKMLENVILTIYNVLSQKIIRKCHFNKL